MERRRISWKRIVAIIFLTWAGLWLLTLPAGHVMVWYFAKQTVDDKPVTALVPQPLPDKRVADLHDDMTISRFGYSLQVPWPKAKAVRDYKTIAFTSFDDGSSLLIFDPPLHMDLLSGVPGQKAVIREDLRSLLGDEAVASHYDYAKAEFSSQPSEISLFHSRHTNARAMVLLENKALEILDGTTAIYSVAAGDFRGFQLGDPQKLPTSVELLLFDARDQALELLLKGPKSGTQPALTQAQINAIIASIKATAEGCTTPGHCG